jgi:hypothetical protein
MRKWARLLVAGFIVTLLGPYPLLAPPIHRIDKNHAELIEQGMTYAKVESIFGQPPGNYDWAVADNGVIRLWDVATGRLLNTTNGGFAIGASGGHTFWSDGTVTALARQKQGGEMTSVFLGGSRGSNTKTWISRHGMCTVLFDQHGRVCGTITDWGHTRVEPPWLKWFQKWFGKE